MQTAGSEKRMYFLDNLRSFIVLLVVVFHASMAYMPYAPWWWYVLDSQRNAFFNWFVLVNDVFIMPIMFFIAGYFAVKSLAKRGTAHFIRDKITRLIIPWIIGIIFLAPAITYFIYVTRSQTPPEYLYYWFNLFFGKSYQQAHYWFLGVLALFCLILAFIHSRNWIKVTPVKAVKPSSAFFVVFVLAGSAGFFAVNTVVGDYDWLNLKYILVIQPTRVVLYTLYFALGVYACRRQWFIAGYSPRPLRWSVSAIVTGGLFVGGKIGFATHTGFLVLAVNAFLHTLFCLCTVLALLGVFQRWVNSRSYLWRRLAANSYAVYYVHQFAVLSLNYALLSFQAGPFVKFFLSASLAVLISYVICEFAIGRLPMFGGGARGDKISPPTY
ncbi:acyltransferase family protein [Sporomusa sp.]|uniref:acyltransferase family protein n=1 Tax=Sporomusa sp. TaxID=2078658 RepID=UPI002D07DE1E|nr:acyltransferase family protein [Sporomusa sp.]HWR43372.1 acyltransferase family protein [Sporomusa sp.]